MNQKKARALRKAAKYRVSRDPVNKRRYGRANSKRIDTGAGKFINVGGNLEVRGPRSLYKEMKKEFYAQKKAGTA